MRDPWALWMPNPTHRRDPRLLLWRLRHWFSGPERGCSCSTCFHSPRRRVPGSQIIESNVRISELRNAVQRAVYIADHLHGMIPTQVWRDQGGDDGQGHYEGEYYSAKVAEELRDLRAEARR